MTFFRETNDLVEARKELIESRERLRLALEAAQDGVWDWDVPSGRMVYNRSWAKMLGLELSEVEPHITTWRSLIHPEDLDDAEERLWAHLNGESEFYETEVRLRHKQGHYVWVLDRGRVMERDAQGRPTRMTGTTATSPRASRPNWRWRSASRSPRPS